MEGRVIVSEGTSDEKDVSTRCSKVRAECVVDYSSEFTNCEVFKITGDLIKWTCEVARRNGFVIVIKTSDAGGHGKKRPRLTFACERGGYYRKTGKKLQYQSERGPKSIGTKKCGSPFTLKGKKLGTDDDWILIVACGIHNHPAAEHFEGHSC